MLSTRQNFYFTQVKNLLIFSKERSALVKSIKTYLSEKSLEQNENFLQTRAQIGKNKLLSIYFNLSHFLKSIENTNPNLYKNLKTLSILSIAGANLEIDKDSVKINSFYSTDIQDEEIMNLFLSAPKRISVLNMLPFDTGSFVTLTFDNFQDVWNYFNRILTLTGQKEKQKKIQSTRKMIENMLNISLNDHLFSWINDEITINYIKGYNDPLVFIGIKNEEKIRNVLKTFREKNILNTIQPDIYKDIPINQIQLSPMSQLFSKIISTDIQMPFYTIYDDYIILSKSSEVIKFFIDSSKGNNNLLMQKKIKLLYSNIKKGNIISFWDLSKGSIKLLESKNIFTRIIKKYNYGMISVEFIDRGIKSKIIITEPRSGGIKTVDGWPVYFDCPIWTSPVAYNIDNKNLDEIILCTEDGKIYIYDFFGEKSPNWPIKTTSKLRSAPFAFFHPIKKDTFIGAASTSGEIYFWNKDGFLLEGLPYKFEGSFTGSPIVKDINNNGILDIIMASDDGQIYAMDINGKSLPGFPVQLEEKAGCNIALFDLDNDKNFEIVCSVENPEGNIYLINNIGTISDGRKLTTGSLSSTMPVIAYFNPLYPNILLITEDGRLFQWNMKGNIVTNFPIELDEKFVNSPAVGDINNDSKKEIILISASGTIYILNQAGEIISQISDLDFKPVENEKILITDIDKDWKKEIIVCGTDNFIRFYNWEGALLYKIKGVTSPFIKDMDRDGKYELITAADDGNVYLYKMP